MASTYRNASAQTQQSADFKSGARAERARITAMIAADPDSTLSAELSRALGAGVSASDFAAQMRSGGAPNRGKAFVERRPADAVSGNRGAAYAARKSELDSAEQ